jgi:hypothetical protein
VLKDCFNRIDTYLNLHKDYWQYDAFLLKGYPNFAGHTQLIDLLEKIDDDSLRQYQQDPILLYPLLKQVIPTLLNPDDLIDLKSKQKNMVHEEAPFWLKNGIKGRKWTQIEQFSQHIQGQLPVLEWCAGKGHLGRLINYYTQTPITAVEWNTHLCEQGVKIAEQKNLQQSFFELDVLQGEADFLLKKDQHAIALHACGDLHVQLINSARKAKTKHITLSPCCYHLTKNETYQAVSSHARQSSELLKYTVLSKQNLKLAVAQQSTSGERQTQLNDQEVHWRLSFDCLQKKLLKTESYLNVPSFPKTLLSSSFREFSLWIIEHKQLSLHLPEDLSLYLEQGSQRFNRLRRSELISQYFRRALELWLVHDRALALQEAGYQVTLSTFCESHITPRNILIQASLI